MQNFTVYKSSAGSGKTFTLVKEYLKLALADAAEQPQMWKHILAVTFTNKAAAEMKARIISALKELSRAQPGAPSAMARALGEELLLDPFTLADRAHAVLRAILHNYTDFAIGTIDAFVHRIVRAFAFDLHLPVNFEVETDADKLLRQAVDLLIGRIGNDDQLTEVLVQFAESKTEEDRSWQIELELLTTARHLLGEEGAAQAERLRELSLGDFLKFRDTLRDTTTAFAEQIQHLAAAAVQRIAAADLSASAFYQGNKGITSWFGALADGKIEKLAEPNSYVRDTFANEKWYGGKATAGEKATIDGLRPALTDAWNRLQELREKHYGNYIVHVLLLRNIYALAALNEVEKLIFSFRAEQNVVHISEFNRIISKIVFAEPVPFIYERLGERYTNYLIDEFQDTSVLQWHNLLPLIDNALGNGDFTMLVGDGKQAIYRWRGGDVEQFARLPEVQAFEGNDLVAEREQSLMRNFKGKHLARNFRSKAEIIQFNNVLFRLLSGALDEDYAIIYDRLEQEFDATNTGGYVHIERLVAERTDEREAHTQRTVEQVRTLVQEGWLLQDIAVLTRTNIEGSRVATALLEAGFPVISSESLLIGQSAAVGFVLAVLRIIDQPSDAIARTQVLSYLVSTGRLAGELHTHLAAVKTEGLAAVLRENGLVYSALVLGKMPLYQRCEEIIRRFGLDQEPDAYLLFFLDEVLSFGMGRGNNPADFERWWQDRRRKASVVVPEGMNAVRVMTIHKSKGLEFPVVIFPFANWKFDTSRNDLWIEVDDAQLPGLETAVIPVRKELEHTRYAPLYTEERNKSLLDHLNVLYVALTRPEHRLYVFTGPAAKKESDELRSAAECFSRYFAALGDDPGEEPYTLGELLPPLAHASTAGEFLRPTVSAVTDWTQRISIRSHAAELWAAESTVSETDRFRLLRALLHHCRSTTDTAEAARQLVLEGLAEDTQAYLLGQEAAQLLQTPELQRFFATGARVTTQAELLLPTARPLPVDRVVVTNGHTLLLHWSLSNDARKRRALQQAAEALSANDSPTTAWLFVLPERVLVACE